ncbi:hypothetical protein SKAU_G00303960 [Synaphobranchus kaupii]|uniref:rRNA-processing protein EBP2 n=1 Tax=Synaphobranchus kaupii TaxID=118154 RepID=A0A9Q1EW90_SYNKA|nr:hypothetical protein SKAU_G00303960 [Synaphobranchus kaupii]
MEATEHDSQFGLSSEEKDSELSDGELQLAFTKGLLKPGLNVAQQEPKATVNNTEGLKQCLMEFQRNLPWIERLDLSNRPAVDIVAKAEGTLTVLDTEDINAEDDFQRELYFYRQAQAAVLEALPRLQRLKIATKRPEDYFAEMAKTDQHMQKIRKKLIMKRTAMEKSEKAKILREQRKYGKKVQIEVLQKRQKEKKAMISAVKKYQKGMTDKLDFLDIDQKKGKNEASMTKVPMNKKGPNAKRKFKDQKFGFGGKKRGSKWNTKESHNDVSGFKAKVAHGKGGKKFGREGKQKPNKRPGKDTRRRMKNSSR